MKELIKQWMTAISPGKIIIVPLKEWINATFTKTKTDTLFKGRMVANRVVK